VVLRVWRASNSPDAQPDKLCAVESIETLYVREMRIRNMVGLSRPGVNSSQTLNLSTTQQGSRLALGSTGALGVGSSINVASSVSLSGIFGRTSMRNLTIDNGENVLNGTANIPTGRVPSGKGSTAPRLDQVPLGEQLHTPFNARELMWNGQSMPTS
jgi:hypothetical protein